MNLTPHQIIVTQPIPGLEALNLTYTKCTTLADVLAAIVASAAAQELYAVSGTYNDTAQTIVITLSNNSTFSIPVALLAPPDPLPVAAFVVSSKIGLTATFDAAGTSPTHAANPITYAWDALPIAGTTGTVTFADPAAPRTAATFSEPGQYTVTLTVTDGNGDHHALTQTLNVARILHVGGDAADESNYFPTVAAAFAWKAANDPTHTYTILVHSSTTETDTLINADHAHVHYIAGAVSTYQAISAYLWDTAPVDFKLTGTTPDPYSPAIVIDGGDNTYAFSATNIDATNLHISHMASSRIAGSPGGRPLNFIDVTNLSLTSVGVCTTNESSVYNTFFHNCHNLTIVNSSSVGDGISWGISSPDGVRRNRLINLYGELSATPQANAQCALYLPAMTNPTAINDILVTNAVLINYAPEKNVSNQDRVPLFIGGAVSAHLTGIRIVGGTLIQMVPGRPAIRSSSAQPDRNTLHMVGTALSGGGFHNCAPDPAATFLATNAQLT